MRNETYAIIDLENNGETFWDELRKHHPRLDRSLTTDKATRVSEDDIEAIKGTPGFDGGDERAPHPIIFMSREEAVEGGWFDEEE